ncbi:MAG: hypothetical protein JWR63_234, partial [Conexibacter sp.]|nr:hypothetical protein [Conexibacter sp.]
MRALVAEATWDPRPGHAVSRDEEDRRRALIGSAVWRHPRWSVGVRPEPDLAAPDAVLVRPRACGLCGSDLHMYESDHEGWVLHPFRMRFPIAIGHEFAGEVVAVGPAVRGLRPGDAVAVEPMVWCGACVACRRGLPDQCLHGEDLGFTQDGGVAELVVVRERQCWSLNALRDAMGESKAYDIGAVVEPTATAYHGIFVQAGGFRPGDAVAVFGCGPIGLASVALARAAGAGRVIAVDGQPARRAL